jgi:ubiquinone/menaquinone biosynthesis C-methylase UbiE
MSASMQLLDEKEIIKAITNLNKIYPYIPSLVLWRALEYAIYSKYRLAEPVLDLACGDGQFFRLVWGRMRHVVGIDIDAQTCERARSSGVYQDVYQVPAHQLPFPDGAFASVFSNCALEHMDSIDQVLTEAYRVARPGGIFLASVVTDKLVEWEMLPLLASKLGNEALGRRLKADFENYHHLQNPFSINEWIERVEKVGFRVKEYYPIAPQPYARVFMLLDELWHVKRGETEIGQDLYTYFSNLPDFSEGMTDIVKGLLKLSIAPDSGAGLVFVAERLKP